MRAIAGPGGVSGALVFTSNGVLNVFDPVTSTLSTPGSGVTAAFPGPISMIEYCAGFYLALVANSSEIFASSPLDPFTWPALSLQAVSVFPDLVVNITQNQNQLWVFGQQSSVVYYLSGNSPFPFDVISGSIMEQGCAAAQSVQKLDNSLFWLGQDSRGYAMIWRASGYTPQRVSNHAVEFAMQGYPNVYNAVAYTFQDQGHSFYQISFPSANAGNGATWVYDAATQQWHERCFVASGVEKMHRSQNHGLFQPITAGNPSSQPLHLVGDPASGNVYRMDIPVANGTVWDFADDFGNPIKRLRRAPHINIEKEWMRYDELVLDLEAGLGPIPAFTGPSSSPTTLLLSDPHGIVWAVTISDGGVLSFFGHSPGTPQTLVLNDPTNTQSWQISMTELGALFALSIPFSSIYPQVYSLATSPSLLQSGFKVATGGATFPTVTPALAPRDPLVFLRWSKDGGHTFSASQQMGAGQAGDFTKRVVQRRMGRARQMLFEVQCTDPIPWRFVDAYLKATAFQPEERLAKKLAKSA